MSDNEPSLHDAVSAAFETHSEPQAETVVSEPSPSKVEDTSENTRDKVAKEEPTLKHEENKAAKEEWEPESLDAPSHWSPEDVDSFNEMDEKARRLYLKRNREREGAFTKKSQERAEELKIAQRFKEVLEPYREQFEKGGVDKFDAFKRGATAHLRLINAPLNERLVMIQKIAAEYGVNLNAPANVNAPQQQPQQQQYDPATQAIFDQLNRHNQYLTNLETTRQAQERHTIESTISNFSNAKDTNGELKYPHFETIKSEMGHLISTGLATSLEQAYDKAVKLNEDLHQEYLNRHYNTMKAQQDTVQKTVASRAAGFNVSGRGSSSPEAKANEALTTRQLLSKNYDAQLKRSKI